MLMFYPVFLYDNIIFNYHIHMFDELKIKRGKAQPRGYWKERNEAVITETQNNTKNTNSKNPTKDNN